MGSRRDALALLLVAACGAPAGAPRFVAPPLAAAPVEAGAGAFDFAAFADGVLGASDVAGRRGSQGCALPVPAMPPELGAARRAMRDFVARAEGLEPARLVASQALCGDGVAGCAALFGAALVRASDVEMSRALEPSARAVGRAAAGIQLIAWTAREGGDALPAAVTLVGMRESRLLGLAFLGGGCAP